MTALTVFKFHGVTVKTWSTEATRRSVGVIQAFQTFTSDWITRLRIINVNIVGAIARFAKIANCFRSSIKSRSARLAQWSSIAGFALACDFIASWWKIASEGEVVGFDGKRTSADQAVWRRCLSCITLVTNIAFFTMVSNSVVLAIEAFSCNWVTGVAVSMTLKQTYNIHIRIHVFENH